MSFANIPGLKTLHVPDGLSDEEKEKLIHEFAIESEKRKEHEKN